MGPWIRWGIVLGFALGGFFDGILLHQILQWHHLLSLVPDVDSLRAQLLWDGAFHALMYAIAAAGLWGLWRNRARSVEQPGRVLGAALMIGFGAWHAVDALLSHWIIGIHRIRLDSAMPLAWDLGWLAVFGIVPLILGWALLRRPGPPRRRGGAAPVIATAALAPIGLGGWALRAPAGQDFTTIVFAPGMTAGDAMRVLATVEARLVWSDKRLSVAVVEMAPTRRMRLYREGAWLVSGGASPAECSARMTP